MFSTEQRDAILKEARRNADTARYLPRYEEPPVEDAVAKWKREAEEAEARKAATQISDSLATRLVDMFYKRLGELSAEFDGKLNHERKFILEVVAGGLGEIRAEILAKIDEEVGLIRADMNLDKAFASSKVIDLPNVLPARKTAS
jgi:hypothetical protein